MLAALSCREPDRVPCCFMSFRIMRDRCRDWFEVAERELAMGLDAMLFIPPADRRERLEHPDLRGIPVRLPPDAGLREWKETPSGEPHPLLHKIYETPAGSLSTVVCQTEDWPHGEHIPFVDDYQIARARENLVKGPPDLAALRYLLSPPRADDIASFRERAAQSLAFTRRHGILSSGGWGAGVDFAGWLCGLDHVVFLAVDAPEFFHDLLDVIAVWNRQRMEVVLESGIDLYIRRGWYESCLLWSPDLYRRFILPHVRRDAQLAHQAGAKFGYIMTSGTTPLLDMLAESGIDALIGVDPDPKAGNDLALMRQKFKGKVCIWGGVNAALTVERGTAGDIRSATRAALDLLGTDGFILSPVDNVTQDTPRAWANLEALVDTWKAATR